MNYKTGTKRNNGQTCMVYYADVQIDLYEGPNVLSYTSKVELLYVVFSSKLLYKNKLLKMYTQAKFLNMPLVSISLVKAFKYIQNSTPLASSGNLYNRK
jgi:hypothetical protein